jgi:hypothetical protein
LFLLTAYKNLEDKDSHCQLLLSAEVPVSLQIKDFEGRPELVKECADWALGYG